MQAKRVGCCKEIYTGEDETGSLELHKRIELN
jgi:hypothetical protein